MNLHQPSNQVLICPQCGGTLEVRFAGPDRRAQCQYCRSIVDLPDLEIARPELDRVEFPAPPIVLPTNDKLARYSLIAGIVGLVGFFPVIGSVVAIFLGREALKKIQQEPHIYTGENLARIGRLLGWIGLGLNLLFLCFGIGANLIQFIIQLIQQAR
jgi:hypothetical protein